MNADDGTYLQRTIHLAAASVHVGGGPFGAVIVRDGQILAEAVNRVVLDHDPTAHAEVLAIRLACAQLRDHVLAGATIYASCEPCPMCLAAIYWARLERVVYAAQRDDAAAVGFDDDRLYRELLLPPAQRSLEFAQDRRESARKVFAGWQQKADKVPY